MNKQFLFVITILISILLCSQVYAVSKAMNDLQTYNGEIAGENKKPSANQIGNIGQSDPNTFGNIPGQTSDGSMVTIGFVSDSSGITDNTQGIALIVKDNAFAGEGESFSVAEYCAFRADITTFITQNPGATPEQINAHIQETKYADKVEYGVFEMKVGTDGRVSLDLEKPHPEGELIMMGTTDDQNQSVYQEDVCSVRFEYQEGMTAADIISFFEDYFRQNSGKLDLIVSVGTGDEDDPDIPTVTTGQVWHKGPTSSTYHYQHLLPEGEAIIYNDDEHKYDVERAIPTSENLYFEANNVDDVLYDISVTRSSFEAGCIKIPIYQGAVFKYFVEAVYGERSGEQYLITPEHVEFGSVISSSAVDDCTYTRPMVTCTSVNPEITQADHVKISDAPTSGDVYITFDKESLNYASFSMSFKNPVDPTVNNPTIKMLGKIYGGDRMTYDTAHSQAQNAANKKDDGVVAEAKADIEADVRKVPGGTNTKIHRGTEAWFRFRGFDISAQYGDKSNSDESVNVAKISGNNQPVIRIIPTSKQNGLYDPRAIVYYIGSINLDKDLPINDVKVHTPVVDLARVESEVFLDQRITKSINPAVQLDKGFKVVFPNIGEHINEIGYNTREYISNQAVTQLPTNWGYIKDVMFDFDVYLRYLKNGEEATLFIPEGNWMGDVTQDAGFPISFLSNMEYSFILPVWVSEGKHTVTTEVVAENAIANNKLSDSYMQVEANKDPEKYIATKTFDIEVVGKIYDLQVNNSNDRDWATKVQSQLFNKDTVFANEFPFGLTQKGRNNLYASSNPNVKSQNKNNSYAYAPKLGSAFIFNFKTKGRKSNSIDISVADNKFYFVSKNGGDAEEVNLYYQKDGQYKKIGNGADIGLKIAATDSYLGIPSQELSDSNRIYPNEGISKYNYSSKVNIGTLSALKLPHSLRMCYNNFDEYMTDNRGQGLYKQIKQDISTDAKTTSPYSSETGEDRVIGSVGRWYAGYALPTTTVAFSSSIPENQAIGALNRNDKSKALTDGYIIVLFDIKSLANNGDYLKYYGPEARFTTGENAGQEDKGNPDKPVIDWTKDKTTPEGKLSITLPNGKSARVPNGAVTMYEAGANIQIETKEDIIY